MNVRNWPDFVSGLLFSAFGIATILLARTYDMGTISDMGPAYFPTMAGFGLSAIGIAVILHSLFSAELEKIERISVWHITMVLGPVLAFAFLLHSAGMVISSMVLILGSALASHEFHWRYAVITAILMTAACYAVFIYGLGLPMPVWPKGLQWN